MKVSINSRVVLSQAPVGPIAPYLGLFAEALEAMGYSAKWVHRQVMLGACFSRWLQKNAVALQDIGADHLPQYLRYRSRRLQLRDVDHAAIAHVIDFLRSKGVVPDEALTAPEPASVEHSILAYETYLYEVRALAETTAVNYVPFVRQFLEHRFHAGLVKLSRLRAADVIDFVRHVAPRLQRRRAKTMTTALPRS